MAKKAAKKPVRKGKPEQAGPVIWPASFAHSVKRMLAYQVEREMARQDITRARMAKLMGTSRAALNRLLDPENASVTLQTMEKAAQILGKKLQIFLNE